MPTRTYIHPLFGSVKFQTASPTWVRGDHISFLSGFDPIEIKALFIPQLQNIPGTHGGNLKFHTRAHAQVLMVFADIERLGLLHHIKTCAGAVNFRLKKPTSGALSKEPSNHAFGIAIDLNADDGSLGASVAPTAPVFEALGFRWGKAFNDPMHFEVKTFIDRPRSIVTDVNVQKNSKPLDLGAKNLLGGLVANIDKSTVSLDLTITTSARKKSIKVAGKGGSQTLTPLCLGECSYVSLPLLAGIAGLSIRFNNDTKTAELIDMDSA
ncbi:MAG: M15 family metallopeptidase [Proteobacteria bacterium]|nr:M15 family metallopeptidase [Pseudomonadota bacterium]